MGIRNYAVTFTFPNSVHNETRKLVLATLDQTSDKAIMLKVKQGDLHKLGLLFERYKKNLFGFFYRLTSDAQLSEDLVQGVFERILKHRQTYTGEGSFTSWLFSIARNLHIDHCRKQKRTVEDATEDMGNYAQEEVLDDQTHSRKLILEKALQHLDEDKRDILIMSRYQGLMYQEIADIMGSSESAIKVKMFRTMNELRTIVQQLSEAHS